MNKSIEDLTSDELLNSDLLIKSVNSIKNKAQRNQVRTQILNKANELGIRDEVFDIIGDNSTRIFQSFDGIVLSVSPKTNEPEVTIQNFVTILESDPYIKSLYYRNEFTHTVINTLKNKQWEDSDDSELMNYIETKYFIYNREKYYSAFSISSNKRNIHPLKNLIEEKPWDGKPRIANFLNKVCNAKDDDYSQEVSRMIFYGGINRLYNPGCKFDYIPILIGKQGCVDKDTEYFNGEEWVKISDYTVGDSVLQYNSDGTAELVKPSNYIKQATNGLWHFKTHYGIDQCLSDNHTVVYMTSKGNLNSKKFEEIRTNHDKYSFKGRFITAFNYSGTGITMTDDEIRLMIAVFADGSIVHKRIRFNIKKNRKVDRLIYLLDTCNIEYTKKFDTTTGYYNITFIPPMLVKHFPKEWYNCSKHQFQVIADEVMFWDGYAIDNNSYSTTSKSDADFIQFVFNSLGYYASIHVDDRRGKKHTNNKYIYKSIFYEVYYSKECLKSLNCSKDNKTKIEKYESLDGMEYCFTVPSHMLVLRRNNRVFITGNCGKSTVVKWLSLMDEYSNDLTSIDGKDAIELMQGSWVLEMGELNAMSRVNNNDTTKAFLTRTVDKARMAYARNVSVFPRQCIIIGTTNDSEFLSDKTGNRRYLPVDVYCEGIEIYKKEKSIRKYILNCWREALYMLQNNKTYLTFDTNLLHLAEEHQLNAVVDDPNDGLILDYLNKKEIGYKVSGRELHTKALNRLEKDYNKTVAKEISRFMKNRKDWVKLEERFYTDEFKQQRGWVKIEPNSIEITDTVNVDEDECQKWGDLD